ARRIHQQQLQGVAAIAPEVAANLYQLEILAANIQSIHNNATRFVLLQTENHAVPESEINKASLRFATDHKRGSLATVLNVMSDCNMNMTKIQSMPVIDNPWQYAFFVDVTFEEYTEFEKAKSILPIMCKNFKVIGAYKSGNK
ncbi:MAG: prephenate dehydratase, partial [Flavobacteriaceae bacterium]|nr:prephenate dehydratase [Flavobacteriaceae bacterium]